MNQVPVREFLALLEAPEVAHLLDDLARHAELRAERLAAMGQPLAVSKLCEILETDPTYNEFLTPALRVRNREISRKASGALLRAARRPAAPASDDQARAEGWTADPNTPRAASHSVDPAAADLPSDDMNATQKLRQLVGEIGKGPASAMQSWPVVHRLLSRMPLDQAEVKRVCEARDAVGLDVLVSRLEGAGASDSKAPDPAAAAVSEEEMKAALRAYNKRLKLGRLSDESRLGNRYTTGGRSSKIDAILPPEEFPPEVWKALAAAGKLRDTGQGFYAPAEDPPAAHPPHG